MVGLAPPAPEQGCILTVWANEHLKQVDNSTLALPTEEKLKNSRQDLEKKKRLQQQVQHTMFRRAKKNSLSNGIGQYSVSIPDQYHTIGQRDGFGSHSSYYYDTKKGLKSETGSINHIHYSPRGAGTGLSTGHNFYSLWGVEQVQNPSSPVQRQDISPERYARTQTYKPRQTSMATLRSSTRHTRSEFGTASRARQSQVKRSNLSDQDSVFMTSVPTSPVKPLQQQKMYSRSLNNLLERDIYQTGAAVGQVVNTIQPQLVSNRVGFQRTVHNTTTTYGNEFQQSRRPNLTAGMAAGNSSASIRAQQNGGHVETQVGSSVPVMSEVDMTLERAVSLLQTETTSMQWLTAAASFIQHECFQKVEARRRVYTLGGISRLIRLLNYNNEEVQRAACAALRNLVFEDNDNKLEVCEQRGMPTLLNLLRETQDVEIKRQITGLLWNLSSNDQLKTMLVRDALRDLTTSIIIPCSGWTEGEYSKHEIFSDTDTFYNATGCLRNVSSAGPEGRKAMRDCEGLIDSLVYYVRRMVADHMPDDKAAENCVCILHNLSFQLESEVPSRYSQNFRLQDRNTVQSNKNVGCFGTRSRKIKEDWEEAPVTEEVRNPRGVEWLWNSIVVRMYLSLIAKSTRNYTQEASLGSLQNLTAGKGPMPFAVAQTVVQRESGLQHIRSMVYSSNPAVKRTAVSLLRNLSRNSSLNNDIARELVPDLVRALPDSAPDSNIANDTTASICYILNNLISNSSQNARMLLQNGGVQKLINISTSDSALTSKSGNAASLVLYNLWSHQDLHSAYKKMFRKGDFVNPKTSKAYHSL